MVLAAMATGTKVMAKEAYAVYNNGTVTFYYDNQSATRPGKVYNWDEAYLGYTTPKWSRDYHEDIVRAVFDSSFKDARPTTMQNCFYDCNNLTTIVGIEYVNTSQVTDFSQMFRFCNKLQSSLDLSGWDTSNVTDMRYMFGSCYLLPSVNVSGWDTSNVTTIEGMFYDCRKLTSLDVSSWDTSKVENMRLAFDSCSALEYLDVSKWNTFHVTDMECMFYGCSLLTMLDLSNWDTSGVIDMERMFWGCSNLTTIFCGNSWTTINVSYSERMFLDCKRLVGGKGTKYNSIHVDASYAHPDGGSSNPGYLTMKESYNLWVDGIQVTNTNCHDFPVNGVDFNPTTKTLTLNSVEVNTYGNCIIVSNFSGDLTIKVNGSCTLKGYREPLYISNSNVTVTGPGKLVLNSESEDGIGMYYSSMLTLNNADVTIIGYGRAIWGGSGNNRVIVNRSSLAADSQVHYYSTIQGLSEFSLVGSEFWNFSSNIDGAFCTYFGKYFYYDTYNRFLCYHGQYYDIDWGHYEDVNREWNYYVSIGRMAAPTAIQSAVSRNEQAGAVYNLNGQRVEGTSQPKGIYIIGGRKVVK